MKSGNCIGHELYDGLINRLRIGLKRDLFSITFVRLSAMRRFFDQRIDILFNQLVER